MQEACSNCCTNPFSGQQRNSSSTIVAKNPETEFIAAIVSSIQSNPNAAFTNHESLPPLQEMFSNLLKAYPLYPNFDLADQIRSHEYYHISQTNHVYLDYIGHGLFSYAQKECSDAASTSCSSPPPSQVRCSKVPFFDISHKPASLSSLLMNDAKRSDFEMVVKERVMKSMNISEDDYSVVFTANQASSFQLLGNSYPFESNNQLITVYDYKNDAVEAMAESAVRKGAAAMTAKFSWPSMRINSKELRKMIMQKGRKRKKGLFVFPLQSRMSGARYSYQWMNLAQENGWHVLLDADALLDKEMETLGLTMFHPDFVVSSFFKVFGENPSGFSCLFVKKSVISELNKTSKTLGIVSLVPTFQSSSKKSSISDAESSQEETLETLLLKEEELSFSGGNQAGLNTLEKIEFKGLDHADELGLVLISSRIRCHVNWLVNALLCLRHPHSENGALLVKIYGPSICINRGPYVGFNIFDWKGEKVEPFLVQKLADRSEISLGCGILQNFWFKERYNKEEKERILEREKAQGVKCECGISVVTVSIGFLNDFKDLYRVWAFVSRFLDADFVEKERWRYQAINQTTIEV